ncbi:MAG TPA: hypothetical protein VKR58_11445 [Aquella sp.]|nr:hypothetical protein [Aquella sp.]
MNKSFFSMYKSLHLLYNNIFLMENQIIKRRLNIANHLITYFPNVIAKLISNYDYHLEGKTYTLVDSSTGSCHDGFICSIAKLPDGRIVSRSLDRTLKIWNPTGSLERVCCITDYEIFSPITCIAILPDGRIVSGSRNGIIKIWNLYTGLCDITFGEKDAWIDDIDVLPDGPSGCSVLQAVPDQRIISYSVWKETKIWNVRVQDITRGIAQTAICDTTIIMDTHTKFHGVLPDGRIITQTDGKSLSLHNIQNETRDTIFDFSTMIGKICIYSENEILCKVIENSLIKIKILNLQTKKCDTAFIICKYLDFVNTHLYDVPIAVLPDGRVVAATGQDNNEITILNLQTGKYDTLTVETFIGHTNRITQIIVLDDGQIVTCSHDKTIKIWN